MIEIETTLRNM